MIALEGVRDALATRLATVTGIPATRYDGTASVSPAPSVAYVEADFVPSGTDRVTLALTSADVRRDGLYVVRWFSATGDSDTLDDAADAVLAVFPTNLTLTTANGETVRVKTRPGPWRGLIERAHAGRSVVTTTIPWWTQTVD
jgi:hypothetical protein